MLMLVSLICPECTASFDQPRRGVGPIEMVVSVRQSVALRYGTSHLRTDLTFCPELDIHVT